MITASYTLKAAKRNSEEFGRNTMRSWQNARPVGKDVTQTWLGICNFLSSWSTKNWSFLYHLCRGNRLDEFEDENDEQNNVDKENSHTKSISHNGCCLTKPKPKFLDRWITLWRGACCRANCCHCHAIWTRTESVSWILLIYSAQWANRRNN